jgi:adhesin/invasin
LELAASADWTVNGTTSPVPGNFAYTPAAGSVLPAGNQTLSTTFTPADTNDYKTTTASISIIVVGPVSLSQSTLTLSQSQLAPGGKTTVTLTAMDANGHQELGGGLKVAFKVRGSGGGKIGAVTDHKNGTYTAAFTAGAKAGTYTITATVGGKNVVAVPLTTMTVEEKAAPRNTAIPSSLSLGKGPANGVTMDAALRRLLLDESTVTHQRRPLFEP